MVLTQATVTVYDNPDFHEYYDAVSDPWMMDNLYNSTDAAKLKALSAQLRVFATCAGDACP